MDTESERIERARAKNLAYIQQQDEQEEAQSADDFLTTVLGPSKRSTPVARGSKGNSSVYITGLSTYMACRQLEGVCNKLGKVRRIKFYKDEKGGLKGDAVVTFSSRATMLKAVDRLNHFEVKPGVVITATEATFSTTKPTGKEESKENTGAAQVASHTTNVLASCEEAKADSAQLDLPSCSIILKHVWDPLEGSDAEFFDDLEEDMRAECSKHGAVEHIHIVADGSVVVRFAELNAAIACLKVMNGRWFAGRKIEARFDQATAENPSDADTKVEAFLASIGE
ncbi:HIV Tat-specific factor 1 [Phytophthora nicotianae]|uniref:HIV Tat-specific factor 1 n=1 Tax=Phytophthora nicotianae TaxID=4792 RepID=A0A0W8CVL9_PHYNI|nr:HIV Tat-specific factor 1 [Phytophthora nicotianae]KUF88195.1 HIV Tat-specific factor 1 [Phytophthora nicotianae]